MKTKYIYLLLVSFLALMSSCEDDATPVMELKSAASLHALAQSEFTFNKDNKNAEFPQIVWDKADYGVSAVVNYVVTLTNKSNNKSVVIGETGNAALTLTNGDMNAWMAKVGAYPGQTYEFTVSLVSAAYSGTPDEASNSLTFKATPYDPNVDNITWDYAYVAVGYPDWDYTTAYLLGDPDGDGVYAGYVNFDGASTYAILDGKDLSKVLAKDQNVAGSGFIEIQLDAEGNVTQTGTGLVWGVIGAATSNGWDKDTPMEYDADTRLWTVVTSLLADDFKFRANNDWGFNYGPVSADKASDLEGDVIANGPDNFKVAKASPYIITLNLTNAGKYTYSMVETSIILSSAEMALPGSYQGWNPKADNCYKIVSAARDFKYTGTHYFPNNTEFKLWDADEWIGIEGDISWNEDKTSGSFAIKKNGGGNVLIETGSYYRIGADMQKMIATIVKTGWGVIGDATPGGWDKDTLMDYNPDTKLWTVTVTLKEGKIKFRWDGAWTVNFGGSLGALTQDGADISVTPGTYTIVLNPEAATATMTQN